MFNVNVGRYDAVARVLIGLMVLSQVHWGLRTRWAWLGLIPVATGLLRRCPLWGALGCSTVHKAPPPS
jgi:hypothetical protein